MEWGLEFQDNLNPVVAPIVHRVKIDILFKGFLNKRKYLCTLIVTQLYSYEGIAQLTHSCQLPSSTPRT